MYGHLSSEVSCHVLKCQSSLVGDPPLILCGAGLNENVHNLLHADALSYSPASPHTLSLHLKTLPLKL